MLAGIILWFGQQMILACDARCHKAWGINRRPREQLSDNEDDFAFLADHELGIAPRDPGTYEGTDGKPTDKDCRLNRWCARECERSVKVKPGEWIELPDFSKRLRNISPQ